MKSNKKLVHCAFTASQADPNAYIEIDPLNISGIMVEAGGSGEGDSDELPKDSLGVIGYLKASIARDLLKFRRISVVERKEHYRVVFATYDEAKFESNFISAVNVIRRLVHGDSHSSALISIHARALRLVKKT